MRMFYLYIRINNESQAYVRPSTRTISYPEIVSLRMLNIGLVLNETNADVHMYIEEFILVENWIHCCTKLNWLNWKFHKLLYNCKQRLEKCENCS